MLSGKDGKDHTSTMIFYLTLGAGHTSIGHQVFITQRHTIYGAWGPTE